MKPETMMSLGRSRFKIPAYFQPGILNAIYL